MRQAACAGASAPKWNRAAPGIPKVWPRWKQAQHCFGLGWLPLSQVSALSSVATAVTPLVGLYTGRQRQP
jgi:hypothetical protein